MFIRTIFWYLSFAITVLLHIPAMLIARTIKDEEKREAFIYGVVSKWSRARFVSSGSGVDITGKENIPDGPCLFVSNHQGDFDIALILAYLDRLIGFVAKIEMKKVPLVRTWMAHIHCIFLDRQDNGEALKALLAGIKLLKNGKSLCVFPEGTRSKAQEMNAFKEGSFVMATKAKVPIVPITLNHTYKIMEENHNWIKPTRVTMIIHPPIETSGLTKDEQQGLTEKVVAIIKSGLSQ